MAISGTHAAARVAARLRLYPKPKPHNSPLIAVVGLSPSQQRRYSSTYTHIHRISTTGVSYHHRSSAVDCCSDSNSNSSSSSIAEPNFLPPTTTAPTTTKEEEQAPQVKDSPFSGLEDVMMGYISGKNKATHVAHSVWKHIIQEGDVLVDATCGNGYDTLAMVKMLADKSHNGHVYGMDIQEIALSSTMTMLDRSLDRDEKKIVDLFAICHSKMEEVIPKSVNVRLVAFNLGYLPGGDKTIITTSETTVLGLEAAARILAPGGLISLVVYVGHPGGMQEFEKVEAFASGLGVENWVCCKLQMLNRPLAPIVVFLFKR